MTTSQRSPWLATLLIALVGCAWAWPQTLEREARRRAAQQETRRKEPPQRPVSPVRPGATPQRPRVVSPGADRSRHSRYRPLVELEIGTGEQVWGSVVLELHQERVPATARNFLRYVDEGFYNETIFHRVLPDFLIQGGGYTSLTDIKSKGLHGAIRNESRIAQKNTRGTIAMARKRDPHSAQAQFFINVTDNNRLDYSGVTRYGHCVFGEVIAGMNIIDRIKAMPTTVSPAALRRFESYQARGYDVQAPEKSQPVNPVMIISARRLERAEYEQRFPQESEAVQPAAVRSGILPAEPPPLEENPELEPPEQPIDEPEPIDEPPIDEPEDGEEP